MKKAIKRNPEIHKKNTQKKSREPQKTKKKQRKNRIK